MTPDDKERLRAFWATRALTAARQAYCSSGGVDPLFHILQAAILPMPLFPDEPYFQVVTPIQPVGAIIDEQGWLRANVYTPDGERQNAVRVCTVRDLVDNLERLANALHFTDHELGCMQGKVRSWITHDDREGEINMKFDRGGPAAETVRELRSKAQALSDTWHKPTKRQRRRARTQH